MWGPDGVFEVAPRRGRGLIGADVRLQSSDECDDLGCLLSDGDDGLIVMSPWCCSCLMVRARERALVSVGSDMAD